MAPGEAWVRLTGSILSDVLSETSVRCDLDVSDATGVIDALLDLICAAGEVRDREVAREDVFANERRSSTGMQHGVAIPHAKTTAVDRLLAAVAVTRNPIEFDSLDGKPCRIFVMTLSPIDQVGPHMRFLAEIGRLLKDRRIRDAVRTARTSSELLAAFVGES